MNDPNKLTLDNRKNAIGFILIFFAVRLALRIFEILVIRTDQSAAGEAFIHKLPGIALMTAAIGRLRYRWAEIGFRKTKTGL